MDALLTRYPALGRVMPNRRLPGALVRPQPGLVCLSGVPVSADGRSPMLDELADRAALHYRHVGLICPALSESASGFVGLAVLSRFAITATTAIPFHDLGPDDTAEILPGIQFVDVKLGDADEGLLRILNVQFPTFGPDTDPTVLASLERRVREFLASWAGDPPQRLIVAGGFNNHGISLSKAFPGLRIGETLHEVFGVDSTVVGQPAAAPDQLLVTADIGVARPRVLWTSSDRGLLTADLTVPPDTVAD
jgi:hypothetical protein